MENPYFIFPVDTTLQRGDSTHVREFVEQVKHQYPGCTFLTYNDVAPKSRILKILCFRLKLLKIYFVNRPRTIYLRYFPGIFIDVILMKALGLRVFTEINAVLRDEAEDLKRSWLMNQILKLDEYFICAKSKGLFTVTPEIQRFYTETFKKAPAYFVKNGVNTELFDPRKAARPHDLPPLENKFVIGFVGSLSPWQDFSTLLAGMHELVKVRGMRQIYCLIIGSGLEGAFIRQRIQELGLTENVLTLGSRKYEEIPGYIETFDLAVAPLKGSRTKNTGSAALKVYEYLSMGKPVLLPDVGSLSEMIRNEGFGLVYDASDAVHFADKVCEVMNHVDELQRMAASRRQYVEQEHSWSTIAHTTLKLMREN